ncbi:glycosyltransferase [Neoroseomonas rubea]|uniref:glycosyltransferase n=1 Tax=Neoroseomonas rubea TaxID=2748666 RepID=UPI0018E03853|nr:glycosyltransferase family A protein [Roseomonas rubea]
MSARVPPFVSVIVPTYRRPALLRRLLLSLVAQDWPRDRYEVIVVHRPGDEESARAFETLARGGPMALRRLTLDVVGPGRKRQHGADHARGAILAFIDDDCEATPGWIAAGVAGISDGLALVQGRTLPHPGQPRRLLEKTISVTGATPYFETCNIFYDAGVFRAVGGFPAAFVDRWYGEDTALGWTVRLAGHRTGYAEAALVHHEVFAISVREWLLAPRTMRHWPALVRDFPALRRELFLGLFLTRLTAAFDLLAVGLLLAPLHAGFLAFALPYVALRFVDRGRLRNPLHLVARLVFGLPRAAVLAWVLLRESVRARSPVL